uniref:C-type lectin domain-containing protein n=1 Tax=Echeneis naucrates TaxID=173247 RepID=A0A665UIE8_ECHNA
MNLLAIFCHLLLLFFDPSTATSLITGKSAKTQMEKTKLNTVLLSSLTCGSAFGEYVCAGQRVCKTGKGRPCYKLAYFSEFRRKLNFVEAELACRRDGGQLLSVESASEQKIIEQLIKELRPTDGDFWIGLRRSHGDEDISSDCPSQYYWVDGSKSTFRLAKSCFFVCLF